MTTLMVMLHGYGSNGDDLLSLAPYFEKFIPDIKFYGPNGVQPSELGIYGYQWFSLADRSPSYINTGLESGTPEIRSLIEKKAAELGVSQENIILLGFSQGATVASYLALSADKPYKAVIGFSGWVFCPKNIRNTKTPICLIHGTEDDIVPSANQKDSKKLLEDLGCTVSSTLIENLAHSIDLKGLEFAANFIKSLED